MYIIETQATPKGRWKKEPIEFADLDEAAKYAEMLYKDGKDGTSVRVVDERYRNEGV